MLDSPTVVLSLSINTFRELVRDRMLYAFVVFAVLVTALGILLGSLSAGQTMRTLSDIGLAGTALIGGVVAVFSGANLVYKELEKKTVYIIFSKPVTGWQFILGKYLGTSLCLALVVFAMGAFLAVALALFNATVLTERAAGFLWLISRSILLVYLELLFVTAMATFFSTFTTPVMSVLFTSSLWLIGHFGQSLRDIGRLSENPAITQFFNMLYWVLPDLASLTRFRSDLLHGQELNMQLIWYLLCYVVAYIVLLLTVAAIITENREFQ